MSDNKEKPVRQRERKPTKKRDPSKSTAYPENSKEMFMEAARTVSKFKFAKTQYFRSIGVLVIVTIIAIVEIQQYLKAKNFEPPVKYIPVYEDSTIVSPTPLNEPLHPDSYNRQWLTNAVTDIFSYSYTTIDTHGSRIKNLFTDNGYESFWKQFTSTPDFIRVKNRSMNVMSMVIEPPVKLHDEEYKITGEYAYYEYKFKLRQVFVSPNDGVIPVTYDMIATVIRQDQKLYKSGVAIHSIRVVSSSSVD